MGYTIFTREQVIPRTKTVPGPFGQARIVPNNGPAPQYPVGSNIVYTPENFDIYSSNPVDRQVLLSDPNGTATAAEIFTAFPFIRTPKELEIRAEGGRRLEALASPYGPEERETWTTQQREAREWLADNAANVPMITALARYRGITISELVSRIMENVGLFETASGVILGQQQGLLDSIYAATDYDQLQAITWGA